MKSQTRKCNLICLCGMFVLLLIGCYPTNAVNVIEQPVNSAQPETQGAFGWWTPEPLQTWQIQYDGKINLEVAADIFNLDLFDTSIEDVQYLHAQNIKVICYLNAGAWENWRTDSIDFPAVILGNDYTGWPGERWLDIRRIDLLAPIMLARLDLCAQKGFDGVDPDNLDGYTNDTGFPLTAKDQLRYNRWLADAAHQRSLAVGLKNDTDQAAELIESFDWITIENCFSEGWCDQVLPFIQAGKPVFAIEYTRNGLLLDDFCDQPIAQDINLIFKHLHLDAWRKTCPQP